MVIAVGQTIVMITGGIDISVGSVTALVCMAVANQMEHHGMNAYMAVLLALFIGVAYGVVQGIFDSPILRYSLSSSAWQVCSLDVV